MEAWRVIESHPTYEVSSEGRVRCRTDRRYYKAGHLLPIHTLNNGYLLVHLDGKGRLVHRLVCWAFHGAPPSPSHEVAHFDGDRANNRKPNLRWATRPENAVDRKRHGTENPPRGERQGGSVLANGDIPKIRKLLQSGVMHRIIANRFGVARTTISSISSGRNWRSF